MRTRHWTVATAATFATLIGCMASVPPEVPASGTQTNGPVGSPFSDRRMRLGLAGTPLIIDRTDLRIGTTVQFNRFPTASELNDLRQMLGLAHVVLALSAWPDDYAPLQVLDQMPDEADLIVVLPGFPPSRAAAEAWNLVRARLRLVVVVDSPPPSSGVVADLNTLRGLERVIVQMDQPSRSGFERLQRPLSFWKVVP
ncbi:MAG TPA: hypothetical protein VEY91_14005 [Candidatus Limnocylindria bacterium]|nr:hypothetical protein [Candidatus Limnocylindria bacterium]